MGKLVNLLSVITFGCCVERVPKPLFTTFCCPKTQVLSHLYFMKCMNYIWTSRWRTKVSMYVKCLGIHTSSEHEVLS